MDITRVDELLAFLESRYTAVMPKGSTYEPRCTHEIRDALVFLRNRVTELERQIEEVK